VSQAARCNRERGITIVTVALLLPALLMVIGLAVDLGVAYAARTSAQSAADAAAMAGAFSYREKLIAPTPQADAVLVANQNTIFRQPIAITAANVTLPTCNKGNCVTVTIPFTVPTFFARAFGWKTISMSVKATAQASTAANGSYCTKPIFLPSSVVNGLTPGATIPDIRPTSPKNSLVPSDYYSLDFSKATDLGVAPSGSVPFTDGTNDTGGGTDTYRDAWSKCLALAVKCNMSLPVLTGNVGGNTGKGIYGGNFTDSWNGINDYGGNHTDTSNSLVAVPIWDSSHISPGQTNVNVIGFAEVFIDPYKDASGQSVATAHFVANAGCDLTTGSAGTGPKGAPLRLVQTIP
jgi:Flp pilus assembly protein TadG